MSSLNPRQSGDLLPGQTISLSNPSIQEDLYDGVQPENDIPEDSNLNLELRYKAFLLLLVFLIPTLVIIYELVSAQVSGTWVHTVQPHLPQFDRIATF
jgi:hypothetical protein